MTTIPTIVVQLVHIDGPLKGEIQEFLDQEISIGRLPACQVQFPKNFTMISRNHARIVREGNRFKLVDQSANGTFVNGKRVTEIYLKSGDVLILAEGGPKVSFLTKIEEGRPQPQALTPSGAPAEPQNAVSIGVSSTPRRYPSDMRLRTGIDSPVKIDSSACRLSPPTISPSAGN